MTTTPKPAIQRPQVTIYTDGACKGNPGRGGWGAWLSTAGHEKELFGGEALTTNNRMELTAVIESLRALNRPARVKVHTDSTYVQQGITAWIHSWKKNGWMARFVSDDMARHFHPAYRDPDGMSAVSRLYLSRDLWSRVLASLHVSGIEAAANVLAKGDLASALGEGIADGLDVAGF